MTNLQALEIVVDMAERKANIYRGIKDPKQRRDLKKQVTALTVAATIVFETMPDAPEDHVLLEKLGLEFLK
jgi:hypothetical protein